MKIATTGFVLLLISGLAANVSAKSMDLSQVLQRVVDHYPSIRTASLQVKKASEENIKVENQLSWKLNGVAAYNRDTSLFGTANDQYSLSGGLNRDLQSGGTFGFNASLSRADAEDTFGPTVPNPTTKTRLDINYRHPLAKGSGNTAYTEGLQVAEAGEVIALSNQEALYDQLASDVIELYLSLANTQSRIESIDKTIDRGQRLLKYINDEYRLGLSEDKDVLQVKARLRINEADRKSLQVLWKRQQISLNRLMGMDWQTPVKASIDSGQYKKTGFEQAYEKALLHNPQMKSIEARIRLADSAIRSSRDLRKDELDLVLFLGNEMNQGDIAVGEVDESEIIGGVSLQFKRGLDKSGLDAGLRQAHYDRGIALQDKKQLMQDLQYNVSSLLAEIEASEQALLAFRESVAAEHKKLDEAMKRYRDGRIETDQIIEFESQLANSELSYELQGIELLRRYLQLALLQGNLWNDISLPVFNFEEYTAEGVH